MTAPASSPASARRSGTRASTSAGSPRSPARATGIHLLVEDEDAERATHALHDAKIGLADDREVLVVDIHDRPGTLGELARELAAANVNIELAYTAFGGARLVIATDDLENARAALA